MDINVYGIAIIPLIVGIVELLKMIGLPGKFAAVASVVLGILVGIYYVSPGDVAQGVLVGLALGLAASGLYSGTKNTIEGIEGKE